ncbi:response regulator transcription factor [Thermosulfuriphilus sp.]
MAKILIVDDSKIMRSGLKAFCEKIEQVSTIIEAENGQVALEKVQKEKPDLVLLDIEMPVMDGLTFLQEIKKLKLLGKVNRNLPIIVLSGIMYNNDANVRKAKMLGATDVMAKPDGRSVSFMVDARALKEKLSRYLN